MQLRAVNILDGPMMMFNEVSALLLYFRLFPPSRRVRNWMYVRIRTSLINLAIGTILGATLCDPRSLFGSSQCSSQLEVMNVVVTCVNVSNGFDILLLPLYAISMLQISRTKDYSISYFVFTELMYQIFV